MGLYQRGTTWWMSFSVNGIQERRSTETSNRKSAQKIYCKVMTELAEGKYFKKPVATKKTTKEMIEEYLEVQSKPNTASSTHRNHCEYAKYFVSFFGTKMVCDLTSRDVSDYKKMRRSKGIKGSTLNNELRFLSHVFKIAINEWEWLEVNPVSKVSRESVEPFTERWLTVEEEELVLSFCAPWALDIVRLSLNTGLRKSELLKLTWNQVDLNRKTLTLVGRQQKNKSSDTIPLNAKAMEILKSHHSQRVLHIPYVFFSSKGTTYTTGRLHSTFDRARKKAGITDVRFHDLRHSFATRLVQNGVDIYKVQKLMRHKNPKMTQRYAHHCPESLRSGVEVLDNLAITNLSHN